MLEAARAPAPVDGEGRVRRLRRRTLGIATGRPGNVVLAACVGALDVLLFSTVLTTAQPHSPLPVLAGYTVAGCAVLAARRAAPAFVLVVTLLHFAGAMLLLTGHRPTLGILLAVYTVAAHCRLRRSVLGAMLALGVVWSLTAAVELREAAAASEAPDAILVAVLGLYALLVGAAWAVGRWARLSREAAARMQQLSALQRREAVRLERAAMARELHDVVTHAVTVMVLQAAGARRILDVEPDRARTALGHVEESGRLAMKDLRTMLTMLRADEHSPRPTPVLGLSDLQPLLDPVRRGGLSVTEQQTGRPRPITPSVELAAVRTVQESVTNATRHAGPGTAVTVLISWSDPLVVRVSDDGAGRPEPRPDALSAGIGLIGLRERVESVGGTLHAASRPGGGFSVTARIPLATGSRPR